MELELRGKRVLITGGSRGIGLAIGQAFAHEGASVCLLARRQQMLEQAAGQIRALTSDASVMVASLDCSVEAEWRDLASEIRSLWGGLDVVVANAGSGRSVPDALPEPERFQETWRQNFTTAEVTARASLPLLAEGGCLLFVTSIAGVEATGAPTDYSTAKKAVAALSKQLADKLAPRVRVNSLAPGNVLFDGGTWAEKLASDRAAVENMISTNVPMRRFGTPEEIASAVLFLCSERARFVTGIEFRVDGGQTRSL
jgi:3-oxoacyl-[acyl-carrier protein] reductase